MARHGATVVVTARNLDSSPGRSGDTLRGTVDAIEVAGGTAFAIPATITDSADAARLVDGTVERAGRLDVLLNNAGVYPEALIAGMSDEDWHDNMDVNMNAVFYVTRAALPVMARQGGGRVYNVSSDLAIRFAVGRVAYSASKAALDVFSQALALEVREQNIEVVSWTPGHVQTDHELAPREGERRDGRAVVPLDARPAPDGPYRSHPPQERLRHHLGRGSVRPAVIPAKAGIQSRKATRRAGSCDTWGLRQSAQCA